MRFTITRVSRELMSLITRGYNGTHVTKINFFFSLTFNRFGRLPNVVKFSTQRNISRYMVQEVNKTHERKPELSVTTNLAIFFGRSTDVPTNIIRREATYNIYGYNSALKCCSIKKSCV